MDAFEPPASPAAAEGALLSPKLFAAGFYDEQLSFVSKDGSSSPSSTKHSQEPGGLGRAFLRMHKTFGYRLLLIIFCGPQLLRGFNSQLSASAAPYIYRQYETPASTVAIYDALLRLPNSCGFLVGLTFETLPLFGYKFAPWMAIASLAGMCGYAAICSLPPGVPGAEGVMALLLLTRLQESTVGLAVQTQIAQKIREYPEEGPCLPAFLWSGNQLLSVLAGLAYGPLSDDGRRDPRFSMALCGCVSVVVLGPICLNFHGERRCELPKRNSNSFWNLVSEEPQLLTLGFLVVTLAVALAAVNLFLTGPVVSLCASIGFMITFVVAMNLTLRPQIAQPASFGVLHMAFTPSLQTALFYFCLDSAEQFGVGPHLNPMFYNTVLGSVRAFAVVVGLVLYVKVVSHWKYRQIFAVCTILLSVAEATRAPMYARLNLQWHISDRMVLLVGALVEDAANIWFAMGNCMMILRCCPENMQGLYVSLIADSVIFGQTVAKYSSAAVQQLIGANPRGAPHEDAEFRHLWVASLVCASLVVFRLPLLWLVPDANLTEDILDSDEEDKDGEFSPFAHCESKLLLRATSGHDLIGNI